MRIYKIGTVHTTRHLPLINNSFISRSVLLICLLLLVSSAVIAQQCTLPSRIFLPTADSVMFEQFGAAVAIDGDYLVAGASENSEYQIYSGKVEVYKFNVIGEWMKIAELTPSNPQKYLTFGVEVAISGNSIAVLAREFNDDGINRSRIYIFEKLAGTEWVSGTETYTIENPFTTYLSTASFREISLLNNNQLTFLSYSDLQTTIEVYYKSAGVFTLSQEIITPTEFGGGTYQPWNLEVTDDLIAIGTEQFDLPNQNIGAVFLYERRGVNYSSSPVMLRPSDQVIQDYVLFGTDVAISGNTVFVQGVRAEGDWYSQTFYIFEKPASGWADLSQPYMLKYPGYIQVYAQLTVNDNYIFSTGEDYKNVIAFKKPADGWSSSAVSFVLDNVGNADRSLIGWKLKLDNNHLIVGSPGRFSFYKSSEEVIIDYYSPSGSWESSDAVEQIISRPNDLNASDDFFGQELAVYNDWLAISASGDDTRSPDAGVVYLFNSIAEKSEPDFKIFNPEEENYTGFGQALALGDSILFISAPYKDSITASINALPIYDIGKVYIYRLSADGWRYSSQIVAPSINSGISFGREIAYSTGYCAVTEFRDGDSESIGRVHVYKEDSITKKFSYLATMDPKEHQRSDFFGQSIIMNDSLMVIGTGAMSPNVEYRKSAYIFKKKDEWKSATEDARLYASDSGWGDRFATSISLFGKYIVAGAPYAPGFSPYPVPRDYIIPGAVYIFKQPAGGWSGELTEIAKLTPSDPVDFGNFGASVAIDHDDIFVGTPHKYLQYNYSDQITNFDNNLKPGKVYHYKKAAGSEWVSSSQELRQIESFEPEYLDAYGSKIIVSDRYLYVGAMLDDTQSGYRTGSVQTMMQLPVIDETQPVVCLDQTPIKLRAFPKNGKWSGPGINTNTGLFNPAVAGVGMHTIIYERSGCLASITIEVVNEPILITAQSDITQEKCIGASISLYLESNRNPADYMWYYRPTLNDLYIKFDSLKQRINTAKAGYYQLMINREVCPDYVQDFLIIDDNPVIINIDPVQPICDNMPVQMSATPIGGFWSGLEVSPDGTIQSANLINGIYNAQYEFTTSLGCKWNNSTTFKIDKLIPPKVNYNGELICGSSPVSITLTEVDDRTEITWYDDNGILSGSLNKSMLLVNRVGNYYAKVSKLTCEFTTDKIQVGALADSLYIPNVFTPNEDNSNDFFEVRANGIEEFYLSVINRYGNIIFETNDLDFQWPANNISSGTYFWSVNYRTCWDERKFERGWVQIVR